MFILKNGQHVFYYLRDRLDIIFYDFWHKLSRSLSWFFFMWNRNEWHGNNMLSVLDKRLNEIKQHMIKNGCYVSTKSSIKIITIAQWYLKRIMDSDLICEYAFNKLEKKYGKREHIFVETEKDRNLLMMKSILEKNIITEEQYSKIYMRVVRRREYLWKKYSKKFFYIMEKHYNRWD